MTQTPKIDLASGLLLLILAVVWGGSFLFGALAVREIPPLTITFHRALFAALALMVYTMIRGIVFPRSLRMWRAYGMMGVLNNVIPFTLIFWGQTQIESGLASILNGMTAMFGALVAGLLLKDEPLTWNKTLGAVLGLTGVAVIMGPESVTQFDLRNLAQLAILGATLSYAFASVWGKVALAGQAPEMNACGMLMASTLIMAPLVLIVDGVPDLNVSTTAWAAVFGLAIISTAVAYILYFAVLARAGAANLMLVTLLIPPFAILMGVVVLNETLTTTAWIGFAIIAMGLLVTDGRVFRR